MSSGDGANAPPVKKTPVQSSPVKTPSEICNEVNDPVIMLAVQPSVILQHTDEETPENLMDVIPMLCAHQVMQNTKTAYKFIM